MAAASLHLCITAILLLAALTRAQGAGTQLPVAYPELTEGSVLFMRGNPMISTCLNADNSTDVQHIFKYTWTQTEGPEAHIVGHNASRVNSTSCKHCPLCWFLDSPQSPNVAVIGLTEGHYTFELSVTDSNGNTDENSVSFNVELGMADQTCATGTARCSDGSKCITASQLCNGVFDCWDGSDEHNCPAAPDVKTDSISDRAVWIGVPTGIAALILLSLAIIFFCKRRQYFIANKAQGLAQPSVVVRGFTPTGEHAPDGTAVNYADLRARDGTSTASSLYLIGSSHAPPSFPSQGTEPPSYSVSYSGEPEKTDKCAPPPSYYDVIAGQPDEVKVKL